MLNKCSTNKQLVELQMKVQKTADNKIEIEGDSKLFAMYNEVNGLVIVQLHR